MKKIILMFVFVCSVLCSFAQFNMNNMDNRHFFRHHIDISQYECIDTLSLEMIYIPSMFDYDEDKIIATSYGQYIIEAPHKDKMVIKTNKDRTKAIVLYNSYVFGRHKEFNINENEKRLVLYYEDDDLYCGYIYDKRFKVAKYFESR